MRYLNVEPVVVDLDPPVRGELRHVPGHLDQRQGAQLQLLLAATGAMESV